MQLESNLMMKPPTYLMYMAKTPRVTANLPMHILFMNNFA